MSVFDQLRLHAEILTNLVEEAYNAKPRDEISTFDDAGMFFSVKFADDDKDFVSVWATDSNDITNRCVVPFNHFFKLMLEFIRAEREFRKQGQERKSEPPTETNQTDLS